MDYIRTLNRSLLARCHRCEWWYEADDSEFPSRFIFNLAYQVCDGDVCLRAIDPQSVVTCDSRGQPLFVHEFTDKERTEIWQWFNARLNQQRDRLLDRIEAEIERDRQSRQEAMVATFQELAWEQGCR